MTLLTTGLAGTRHVGPGNEDYSGSHFIVLKAAAIHDSVKITRCVRYLSFGIDL